MCRKILKSYISEVAREADNSNDVIENQRGNFTHDLIKDFWIDFSLKSHRIHCFCSSPDSEWFSLSIHRSQIESLCFSLSQNDNDESQRQISYALSQTLPDQRLTIGRDFVCFIHIILKEPLRTICQMPGMNNDGKSVFIAFNNPNGVAEALDMFDARKHQCGGEFCSPPKPMIRALKRDENIRYNILYDQYSSQLRSLTNYSDDTESGLQLPDSHIQDIDSSDKYNSDLNPQNTITQKDLRNSHIQDIDSSDEYNLDLRPQNILNTQEDLCNSHIQDINSSDEYNLNLNPQNTVIQKDLCNSHIQDYLSDKYNSDLSPQNTITQRDLRNSHIQDIDSSDEYNLDLRPQNILKTQKDLCNSHIQDINSSDEYNLNLSPQNTVIQKDLCNSHIQDYLSYKYNSDLSPQNTITQRDLRNSHIQDIDLSDEYNLDLRQNILNTQKDLCNSHIQEINSSDEYNLNLSPQNTVIQKDLCNSHVQDYLSDKYNSDLSPQNTITQRDLRNLQIRDIHSSDEYNLGLSPKNTITQNHLYNSECDSRLSYKEIIEENCRLDYYCVPGIPFHPTQPTPSPKWNISLIPLNSNTQNHLHGFELERDISNDEVIQKINPSDNICVSRTNSSSDIAIYSEDEYKPVDPKFITKVKKRRKKHSSLKSVTEKKIKMTIKPKKRKPLKKLKVVAVTQKTNQFATAVVPTKVSSLFEDLYEDSNDNSLSPNHARIFRTGVHDKTAAPRHGSKFFKYRNEANVAPSVLRKDIVPKVEGRIPCYKNFVSSPQVGHVDQYDLDSNFGKLIKTKRSRNYGRRPKTKAEHFIGASRNISTTPDNSELKKLSETRRDGNKNVLGSDDISSIWGDLLDSSEGLTSKATTTILLDTLKQKNPPTDSASAIWEDLSGTDSDATNSKYKNSEDPSSTPTSKLTDWKEILRKLPNLPSDDSFDWDTI